MEIFTFLIICFFALGAKATILGVFWALCSED